MNRSKYLVAAALLSLSVPVFAQATIDQNKALAGNVTPGDAPGFPITISLPGHYKLMGNLNVPEGTSGILITAEGVTLDLNGFTVRGPVSCTRDVSTKIVSCSLSNRPASGIESPSTASEVLVRNGQVRGFQGNGVSLGGPGSTVEGLKISQNKAYGLILTRGHAVDVNARLNAAGGISITGVVTRSTAHENGDYGISADYIQESYSSGNRSYGINGRVRACVATDNGSSNFSAVSISLGGNASGYTPY